MAAMTPENPAEAASLLMKRGIALLNENTPESLAASLTCFDQALALRRALPPSGDPWSSHVLAASWMNRADALTRLGSAENLAEAVRSYDEALAVLRGIPLDANPLYRRRFAIAWLNRGISLQEQGTAESLAEALKSFEQSIETLRDVPEEVIIVASGWMNRANVLLRLAPPQSAAAKDSASTAMMLLSSVDLSDVVAAESAMKARHILCQAIADLLASSPAHVQELVSSAIDAVGTGLELARHWEQRGETRFRPLITGLFRFGALLYQRQQPEALTEFLREYIGGESSSDANAENIEMHKAAVEALSQAWNDLQSEGFTAVNTPRFDRWLETLRALRTTGTRLRELRASAEAVSDK